MMFGKGAIHEAQKRQEGRPATTSCWWGYILTVWKHGDRITVPEVKIEKFRHLVFMDR